MKGAFPEKGDTGQVQRILENREISADKTKKTRKPIDKEKDRQRAKLALMDILNMEKKLPDDFDMKKELQEAREEK
ncbi:MAG: hypothetical protein HFH97_21075 [Lachnospiraceae bacterium]|nr:hypothetical protein [Lachnospiraceae bacterium]